MAMLVEGKTEAGTDLTVELWVPVTEPGVAPFEAFRKVTGATSRWRRSAGTCKGTTVGPTIGPGETAVYYVALEADSEPDFERVFAGAPKDLKR